MDLVLHAIEPGHHHRGEREVGVRCWVRKAYFDTTRFIRLYIGDADRCRTVARRVGKFHRCFEAWDQTFVRIGTRVGDRVQGARMFDDATDVMKRKLRQARIAITRKQVLATFPDRHVHMHARAVVTDDWLRHECRGLAVAVSDVLYDVFQALVPVSTLHESFKLGADFTLACVGNFMVMHLYLNANRLKRGTHGRADILQLVHRRHWKIAAFDGRAMAEVAAFKFCVGRPGGFFRVNLARASRHVVGPFHCIENEEFGFRSKIGRVAQTASFQIRFSSSTE